MVIAPTVILPVRDFAGMSRLKPVLDPASRRQLARGLCLRAVTAAHDAGLTVQLVSSSHEVSDWANDLGVEVVPDPGEGLSGAASAAVQGHGDSPWMVVHADLPLITGGSLRAVADIAGTQTVLVPSHDGGTNVIASHRSFTFSYGQGSFHRHLSSSPRAAVISNPQLSFDIDTPAQLAAFLERSDLPSLMS